MTTKDSPFSPGLIRLVPDTAMSRGKRKTGDKPLEESITYIGCTNSSPGLHKGELSDEGTEGGCCTKVEVKEVCTSVGVNGDARDEGII